MLPLIIGAGVLLALSSKKTGDGLVSENHFDSTPADTSPTPNAFNLPDIMPTFQGGTWSTKWDDAMLRAANDVSVPWALMKAHAIRESALNQNAYRLEPSGKASFGLMQILWWPNSNRFAQWGYPDDWIGADGSQLYTPVINCTIAAHIMRDNWDTYGNLRDIINAYNTGKDEASRSAPGNYVDDVLSNYQILIGKNPLA